MPCSQQKHAEADQRKQLEALRKKSRRVLSVEFFRLWNSGYRLGIQEDGCEGSTGEWGCRPWRSELIFFLHKLMNSIHFGLLWRPLALRDPLVEPDLTSTISFTFWGWEG